MNHRRIGLNYFYFSMITGLSGALLATAIRLELSYPGSAFFCGDSLSYLQVITAHALIMIFFVVIPIFFGGFANFLLPSHIGSKDVAYPRLNSLGFWLQPCGYLLIAKMGFMRTVYWKNYEQITNYFSSTKSPELSSLLLTDSVTGGVKLNYSFFDPMISEESVTLKGFLWKYIHNIPDAFYFLVTNAKSMKMRSRGVVKCAVPSQTVAGWTFMTPFSSKTSYTGFGAQDMLILGVYYSGMSTTISMFNLLATSSTLSIPGLSNSSMLLPFMSMSILLMLRALFVITPVLGSAMLMLALDSHWQTSFFDFAYGGDPIFFHHLFWFFGHPEVYVLVIPAFGIMNSVLPALNSSSIASKHHLIWAMYMMNYMGFLVWGHHMYLMGLDHSSRALYSTITIMISMPATIKVVNWTFTLLSGSLHNSVVFWSSFSFFFFFLVAGFTGMWLSHVSLNIAMHDTMYVVAHFHLMLSGAVIMSIFAGFYFYFSMFFQCKYSFTFSMVHMALYTAGQWMTFMPLFWVSFAGLPSSMHDYPSAFMGWQGMSSVGHFITLLGVIAFYFMLLDSKMEKKLAMYPHTLISRNSKRVAYFNAKFMSFFSLAKSCSFTPSYSSIRLVSKYMDNN